MTTIGLDIGGANLKAATAAGGARSRPFALWKNPNGLTAELATLIGDWLPSDRLAVTMTGELCDCFSDRAEGVRHIVRAVTEVAGQTPVFIWRTDGQFATPAETVDDPLPAASANWLALATFAATYQPAGPAILLDIGSTTTDIVPLMDGKPAPRGRTDYDRLKSGELLYTGARRTPVSALLEPGEGMAEFFATTLDVYLVLGEVPEDESDRDTADGRPATKEFARARLARMLGADLDSIPRDEINEFARRLSGRQNDVILQGVIGVMGDHAEKLKTCIVAGSGAWLAEPVLRELQQVYEKPSEVVRLSDALGATASIAACAVAVATLLSEQ